MASDNSTGGRRVVGNISLSIDGRVTGLGGDMDMGWIARPGRRSLPTRAPTLGTGPLARWLDSVEKVVCLEIVGGGTRLFEDGLPATSWSLTELDTVDSGAMCLYYDRIRGDG